MLDGLRDLYPPNVQIRHQPFDGALGDTLIERIGSGEYERLEFMVAFAKQSGVLRLKEALYAFRSGAEP